jgi:hypothetical protein
LLMTIIRSLDRVFRVDYEVSRLNQGIDYYYCEAESLRYILST